MWYKLMPNYTQDDLKKAYNQACKEAQACMITPTEMEIRVKNTLTQQQIDKELKEYGVDQKNFSGIKIMEILAAIEELKEVSTL